MAVLLSQEIERRGHFAELCNRRRLLRHAVEIGTEKAGFATRFLDIWKGDQLVCLSQQIANGHHSFRRIEQLSCFRERLHGDCRGQKRSSLETMIDQERIGRRPKLTFGNDRFFAHCIRA